MAIGYDFEEIKLADKVAIGATQATIECNIDTLPKGGVSKILSLSGDVKVGSATAEVACVKVVGVLNCKVIALNEEMQFTSYDYNCDFTASIATKEDFSSDEITAKACIIDMDSAISGSQINLQAVCDIKASANCCRMVRCLTSVSGDIFAREDDEDIAGCGAKINQKFAVIDEYESGTNIDKVLLFDYNAIVCSSTVTGGMITLGGEIGATVVYESAGTITTKAFLLPYSEEIAADIAVGDKARIRVNVASAKIVLGGSEDNNIMRLEFSVTAVGAAYNKASYNIISDVYSVANELKVTSCVEKYYAYCGTICVKEKIAGTAEIAEQSIGVRRVLSCCASRNCVTNIFANDGGMTVEGVMSANVIYEDANAEINSMQIELPYSLPFDNDKIDDGDRLSADAMVEILSVKVKRDREIEVTALITLQVEIEEQEELECIVELVVGDSKPCNEQAITIYQTKVGESIWEIAKAVGASVPMLIKQNASMADGIGRGQKVCYYRQLIAN